MHTYADKKHNITIWFKQKQKKRFPNSIPQSFSRSQKCEDIGYNNKLFQIPECTKNKKIAKKAKMLLFFLFKMNLRLSWDSCHVRCSQVLHHGTCCIFKYLQCSSPGRNTDQIAWSELDLPQFINIWDCPIGFLRCYSVNLANPKQLIVFVNCIWPRSEVERLRWFSCFASHSREMYNVKLHTICYLTTKHYAIGT